MRPAGDPLGNVWLSVGPEDGPLVAVAAHADQIGLIVTYVDEQGYVSVERIGGLAPLLVPGRHFVDPRPRRPRRTPSAAASRATSSPMEERGKAPELHEQFLDIGAAGREAALARVAVGDPVTFTPDFVELSPGVVATQALDDRAGVYAMIRALELYAAAPGAARLTGFATVHEETTFMGAKALARRLRPDVLDRARRRLLQRHPAADAKELAGEVRLGAGPVLSRGAGSSERLLALAREVAAAEGVPVQIKAYPGETEHRRRRADGGRRGRHAHRRPAGALHALAVRGRLRRRPRGGGAPGRRARAPGRRRSARPSPTRS